ncbi:MAG: ABC transporter ATP-binding protein [Nitrospirae bacterium]|nr:ABC transporter ATP-binding protein [Nitrospirota bacterium]
MNEPIITFENVTKSYHLYHNVIGGVKNFLFDIPKAISSIKNSRFEALHNISFEVYRGETIGVMGRNGAGKSTILGLIAGVLKPSKGRVSVNGRISPLLELGAGFNSELTGRENIILNGVLLGLTRAEVINKMHDIIEFSELAEFIDQPIRVYSSGMVARLGFSVAIHTNPDILLVDEILAVGDVEFQKKCYKKMLDFKKKGVTIVLVSHSPDDIEKFCDRAIVVVKGEIGDIRRIASKPYFTNPESAFIRGMVN